MSYNINIQNGTGTERVLNGNYNVSVMSVGYDSNTITPKTLQIVGGTDSYSLTIGATGTLTLHVSEEGTVDGTTPIVGAKFIRTDSTGQTTYGNEVVTDSSGNAILNYLPYASTDAPIVYYKQTFSDEQHEFDDTVKNISLTIQETTVQVQNLKPAERTFILTDANYPTINISTASLMLE